MKNIMKIDKPGVRTRINVEVHERGVSIYEERITGNHKTSTCCPLIYPEDAIELAKTILANKDIILEEE